MSEQSLGLMVSGDLGYVVLRSCAIKHEVVVVFTDKKSDSIIDYAKKSNFQLFVGNPRNGATKEFREGIDVELLLSINYLFLVESDIIEWPLTAAVNFHGSLLPKYRGRTPHIWAIINNEKETGVTAHYMIKSCDAGAILRQIAIPIKDDDTGAIILEKYAQAYPSLIDEVILSFKKNSVTSQEQDSSRATCFGKRIPEDGEICWDWQRERIRNWVRAQAYPYPGAYSFTKGSRLIIDLVEFDDYGYRQDQFNGLVLSLDPIRIKTPNGALRLSLVRDGRELVNVNDILGNHEN